FAMEMAGKVLSQRRTVPDEIEQPGPEGDAVGKQVGQAAYDLNVQQYRCAGLNFGYFYDRSPIIPHDGGELPGFTIAAFTPSSTIPRTSSASCSARTSTVVRVDCLMAEVRSLHRVGIALVGAAAIAWSTAPFFTRLLPYDSWTILFWRGVFASAMITAIMLM